MMLEAIEHRPYREYVFPIDEHSLVIRLRTKKGDLNNVILIYQERFDPSLKGTKLMEKTATDALYDYYQATLHTSIKRFKYMFYLEDTYETRWYNAEGFHIERPAWGFFTYANISIGDLVQIPEWFQQSAIYQVFPDRYHNPSIVQNAKGVERWKNDQRDLFSYYGGTLQGILQKIDYIKGLGINALYLNPIFRAKSYHRYDTVDYFEVDPLLGTQRDFKALVDACHERKIKVILDVVFNHTSPDFFAFQDILQKGEHSQYRDWYKIDSFPVQMYPQPNYECFGFFGGMPKINTACKEVIDYFKKVIAYWMTQYGVDGFRLDAADEVDRHFWRVLCNKVKASNEEVVFIGEVWDEASSWVNGGDQFDSAMNYPLKSAINELFAYNSISVQEFLQKIDRHRMRFHPKVLHSLVNIVDSHDTARFLTECNRNKNTFLLGIVFQFTFPGVPMVYYGDEVGMQGGGDPACRMPMPWSEDQWDRKIQSTYQFLIHLRTTQQVLSDGNYTPLKIIGNKNILAFGRENASECIVVIINTRARRAKGAIKLERQYGKIRKVEDLKSGIQYDIHPSRIEFYLRGYEWQIYKVTREVEENR